MTLGLPRRSLALAETTSAPQYWLHIVPAGGIDGICSLDPKRPTEVAQGVHIPYRSSEIVATRGGFSLAPSLAALAPWAQKFAVIRAVRTDSANHVTGNAQAGRLRTRINPRRSWGAFEYLAMRNPRSALPHVMINVAFAEVYCGNSVGIAAPRIFGNGPNLIQALESASPNELQAVGAALAKKSANSKNLSQSALFLQNWARAPRFSHRSSLVEKSFRDTKLGPYEESLGMQQNAERALWMFENDIAQAVTLFPGSPLPWDDHGVTYREHEAMTAYLGHVLAELFARIEASPKLAGRTAVIVGSEIGRYPHLNAMGGKDHFPQVPMLFYGRPFRVGSAFASTGRSTEALPVDLKTGKPQKGGHWTRLDDVGATVLQLAGLDPELAGFSGSFLSYLVQE